MPKVDFANIKPSLWNLLIFWGMWLIVSNVAHYLFTATPLAQIPGLAQLNRSA